MSPLDPRSLSPEMALLADLQTDTQTHRQTDRQTPLLHEDEEGEWE